MARRARKTSLGSAVGKALKTMTQAAMRVGKKAIKESLRAAPAMAVPGMARKPKRRAADPGWTSGIALGPAGPRHYKLYKPPTVRPNESLPLLVMLHGCGQDAEAFAASTRMNAIAKRERFFVLYPEQDRLSNPQGCWNWYDTRNGRAKAEAHTIEAAIDHICLTQGVDRKRIALAGISAGAGMAVLLATFHPERYRAVAMHSGVGPGVAHSSASAIKAMLGKSATPEPLPPIPEGVDLPPLLVIHGTVDRIVAPINGRTAAERWAARVGATPGQPRSIQRGTRYPATITDYKKRGRLVATLCEIDGLGHAWSGGAAGEPFSDPQGPDVGRMIFAEVRKALFHEE